VVCPVPSRLDQALARREACADLLAGNPDPELLSDLDPSLVGRAEPREIRVAFLASVGGRHINWTIAAAPNTGWVTQVFGEPDVERLWDAVATATRLDADDPVAAWQSHTEKLQARADALNARAFDAIRFSGPGTELEVGLVGGVPWWCATLGTAGGITQVPNLPTEAVVASPD
jgi:aminopeptidase